MTDRPIIFSAPMVRALLDGRKTQTRRFQFDARGRLTTWGRLAQEWERGKRDQWVWVRENFALHRIHDPTAPSKIKPTLLNAVWFSTDPMPNYKIGKGRPSIHMPRRLSRLTLSVTDVRVQPLQQISENDAIDEGASPFFVRPNDGSSPYTEGFRMLWESLHGDGSWIANSWIVALTFTVERRNIDEVTP